MTLSYARSDLRDRDELEGRVAPLARENLIRDLPDRTLTASWEWRGETHKPLEEADVILLLVSPEYLDSKNCLNESLRAMRRQDAGVARVIPIILRPFVWTDAPFGRFAGFATGWQAGQRVARPGRRVREHRRRIAPDHRGEDRIRSWPGPSGCGRRGRHRSLIDRGCTAWRVRRGNPVGGYGLRVSWIFLTMSVVLRPSRRGDRDPPPVGRDEVVADDGLGGISRPP